MGLWERMELNMTGCIALVGGGGKTTLLYTLAREAWAAGRRVVITTTTHICPHPSLPTIEGTAELAAALAVHGAVILGRRAGDKLAGLGDVSLCKELADVVLVEADGARGLPLKAPADHEPVIPPCASGVVAVAGLDCIGQTIVRICHRPGQVCALLDKLPEDPVMPEDVADLLASPAGGRKGVGAHMAYRCLLNKADTPQREAYAAWIKAILAEGGILAAVAKFTEEERDGRCWF